MPTYLAFMNDARLTTPMCAPPGRFRTVRDDTPDAFSRGSVSQAAIALAADRWLFPGARSSARGKLANVSTVASYGLAIIGFAMMVSAVLRTLWSRLKYM